MKKYMLSGAIFIVTDNDLEIRARESYEDTRKLIYKKSDPQTHDNQKAKRLLERWNSFENKETVRLREDFPIDDNSSAYNTDLFNSEIEGVPV